MPRDDSADLDTALDASLLNEALNDVLDSLNERERLVLELRVGLDTDRSRTLEEVGKHFGLTRERIRQIESKALKKLRHPSRTKPLKAFNMVDYDPAVKKPGHKR